MDLFISIYAVPSLPTSNLLNYILFVLWQGTKSVVALLGKLIGEMTVGDISGGHKYLWFF